MGVSIKVGNPQSSSILDWDFHPKNPPAIKGTPHLMEPPKFSPTSSILASSDMLDIPLFGGFRTPKSSKFYPFYWLPPLMEPPTLTHHFVLDELSLWWVTSFAPVLVAAPGLLHQEDAEALRREVRGGGDTALGKTI